MRVLIAHNRYQRPGGEDQVFEAEAMLLRDHGHEVIPYTLHNDDIEDGARARLASTTVWSSESYRELRAILQGTRPEVIHFHNTLPLLSPAAYYAARAEGVPVVQTLHNFRLLCANALLFRAGAPCQECIGKAAPWPAIAHRCYRGSRGASATVATMLLVHRGLGTWQRKVDRFIALSEFARGKFIEGGLPGDRISVKPNFVLPTPEVGTGGGEFALFVGRLSPEKGVETLLDAWRLLGGVMPLKIAGAGPLMESVRAAARDLPGLEYVGPRSRPEVLELMGRAAFLVLPSVVYENFPMTLVEAFACGLPVLASGHGSMEELVDPGRTGQTFTPGDPSDLARRVRELHGDPEGLAAMRLEARAEHDRRYRATDNLDALLGVYQEAIHAGRPALV